MFLIGCLFAFAIAFAPRVVLLLAWIFSNRWQIVWQGQWFLPLLGIIFLPFTTIMYMLSWSPTGIQGWDWLWIGLGLFMDIMKWAADRREPEGDPRLPAGRRGRDACRARFLIPQVLERFRGAAHLRGAPGVCGINR